MIATASLLVLILAGPRATPGPVEAGPGSAVVAGMVATPGPADDRPEGGEEAPHKMWFTLGGEVHMGFYLGLSLSDRVEAEGTARYVNNLKIKYYFLPFTARGLGGSASFPSPLRVWLPTRGTGSLLQVSIAPAFWTMLAEEIEAARREGD